MTNEDKTKELLERNVVEVLEKNHLERRIRGGDKLRIKLGIDPTGPKLHLGRAIALWKLREFQDLGHQIVLIIGDFTAMVGDASDKISSRPRLTKEEIEKNMSDYKEQIAKILDIKKVEFCRNSEWLSLVKLEELVKLASLFTVHQLINRRNFKERFEAGNAIGFHEFIYPLMQGYDSVAVKADVEIGGTDQLFNLLAGRKIQEFYGQNSQDIMTLEMLEGTDGEKMSTSRGNVINIIDEPNDMFGKIMAMGDKMTAKYFKLITKLDAEKVPSSPVEAKKTLGYEIVKLYYGEETAGKARGQFEKVFQKKELPDEATTVKIKPEEELGRILLKEKFVSSNAAFRRLIKESAVDFNGVVVADVHFKLEKSGVVRIGKKKFLRVLTE